MTPAKVTVSERLKASVPLVEDVADDPAGGAAIADLQGAGRDGGAAGVGVGAGQDSVPVPAWVSEPVPETRRHRSRVGAVEGQRAVVGDVAGDEPVVPPLPICSVPALIVVPPV